MEDQFKIFTLPHFVLLSLIPLIAAGLTWWSQRVWYWYYVRQDWYIFPYSLPLQLCDILVWIAVAVMLFPRQRTYELLYYWGLTGTLMAVLTPDLSTPLFSYVSIRFFSAHGGIIIAVLFLTWRKVLRPEPASHWRALLFLHLYAMVIGIFNLVFDTNFFYLRGKPSEPSLLDHMGPWPVYILVGDLLALLLFWLLWLPFRKKTFAITSRDG
jgi:hypothetical integral membrane protein (TIGR02206 family)